MKTIDISKTLAADYDPPNVHVLAGFPNVRRAIELLKEDPSCMIAFVMLGTNNKRSVDWIIRNCNEEAQLHQVKGLERRIWNPSRVVKVHLPIVPGTRVQDVLDEVRRVMFQPAPEDFWRPTKPIRNVDVVADETLRGFQEACINSVKQVGVPSKYLGERNE